MTMTRDEAAVKAQQVLGVDEVEPHVDRELEDDALCGGFAFVAGESGAVIGYRGGYQTSVLDLSGETIETLVIGWLAEQRHQYGVEATTPEPTRRMHPCPICGRPTAHQDRYPASVCADCASRVTDRDGRRVVGYNEGLGGGFIAFYADSPTGRQTEIAGEVLATGRCWIDGIECTIGEARFGGVVVQRVD